MERDPQSKRLKLICYAEERIQINERFSVIKNQIDIDAETLLLRINYESGSGRASNIEYQQRIQAINDSRASLIGEIETISKFYLDKLYQIQQENIIVERWYDIFPDHCLYLDTDTIKELSSNKYRLGLLIKTDFCISEIQAKYLKTLVQNFKNIELKENNQAISVGINEFLESFYLRNKIIQSIDADQNILDIKTSQFSEITQLKVQHVSLAGFLSITTDINWKTNFSNLKILHLVSLNIQEIDNYFLASDTLEELDLAANEIASIRKGSFNGLKQLKRLVLSSNGLQEIEKGSFDNLIELEELDLSNNYLTEIKDSLFLNLNKLNILDLSDNCLKKIKTKSLEGLTSLTDLDLTANECSFEQGLLDNMPNLKVLSLHYENMTITTKELSKLATKNLEELCFTSNASMHTPLSWLKTHINLHKLTLQMEQSTIHKSLFGNFNNLQELTISHTTVSLAKIPENLINLKQITFFRVEFTQKSEMLFKNVPLKLQEVNLLICEYCPGMEPRKMLKNIRNVKSISFNGISLFNNSFYSEDTSLIISKDLWRYNQCLTELDLAGNNIHTYEIKSLKGLDNLEKLILRSNRLACIQKGKFSSIKHIKHLDLSDNEIELIDKNAFKGFSNLEYLNMSDNEMKKVHKNIFSDLCELKHLELSSSISRMDSQIFKNLKKLEYLDISSNKIERLDDNVFSDLSNLKYLNLDSNEIEEINSCLFRGMPLLSELDLSSNNIKSIGDSFCELMNLEKLCLNYNQIENIDLKSLSKLENLKVLELCSNEIKQIDTADLNCLLYRERSECEILLQDNPVYKSIYPIGPFNCKFN